MRSKPRKERTWNVNIHTQDEKGFANEVVETKRGAKHAAFLAARKVFGHDIKLGDITKGLNKPFCSIIVGTAKNRFWEEEEFHLEI